MEYLKVHGTGNDFVLLPDLEGRLSLTAGLVRALCDRRFGIGADGVLRVVRTAAAGEAIPDSAQCEYFMDYRNADGSLAQMCGNGARAFADYLLRTGAAHAPVRFATRGGARTADVEPDGTIRIDMGPAVLGSAGAATVTVPGRTWPATPVHVPNPHAVVFCDDLSDAGSLAEAPLVEPGSAFPEGANVEFVVVRRPGRIAMRVHERGVGETLSCGTGACAAAVAYRRSRDGHQAGERHGAGGVSAVQVDVPGGTLQVGVRPDGTVTLAGPVATVAAGTIDEGWLGAAS